MTPQKTNAYKLLSLLRRHGAGDSPSIRPSTLSHRGERPQLTTLVHINRCSMCQAQRCEYEIRDRTKSLRGSPEGRDQTAGLRGACHRPRNREPLGCSGAPPREREREHREGCFADVPQMFEPLAAPGAEERRGGWSWNLGSRFHLAVVQPPCPIAGQSWSWSWSWSGLLCRRSEGGAWRRHTPQPLPLLPFKRGSRGRETGQRGSSDKPTHPVEHLRYMTVPPVQHSTAVRLRASSSRALEAGREVDMAWYLSGPTPFLQQTAPVVDRSLGKVLYQASRVKQSRNVQSTTPTAVTSRFP